MTGAAAGSGAREPGPPTPGIEVASSSGGRARSVGTESPSGGRARAVARVVLGVAMIAVGVLHFVAPAPFAAMVPSWLPAHLALVYVSGLAEIAGGVGLFVPRLRRAAAWGLIALYLAVFPANVHMALHDLPLGDYHAPSFALWARLPFQLLFIAWAYWAGQRGATERT